MNLLKDKKSWARVAMVFSLVASVMAGVVSFTQKTIWIAGTQWILVAIVLGVYAVYLNSCSCGMDDK